MFDINYVTCPYCKQDVKYEYKSNFHSGSRRLKVHYTDERYMETEGIGITITRRCEGSKAHVNLEVVPPK